MPNANAINPDNPKERVVLDALMAAGPEGVHIDKLANKLAMAFPNEAIPSGWVKDARGAIDRLRAKFNAPIYNQGGGMFAWRPDKGPWDTKHRKR